MGETPRVVQPGANVRGRNGLEEEKIVELEEKERSLMLQSTESARAAAVSPSLHRELAEVRVIGGHNADYRQVNAINGIMSPEFHP